MAAFPKEESRTVNSFWCLFVLVVNVGAGLKGGGGGEHVLLDGGSLRGAPHNFVSWYTCSFLGH